MLFQKMRELSAVITLLFILSLIRSPAILLVASGPSYSHISTALHEIRSSPIPYRIPYLSKKNRQTKAVHNASFYVGKCVNKKLFLRRSKSDERDSYSKISTSTTTTTVSSDTVDATPPKCIFSIRKARFKDLSKVSNIIVESFYKPSLFKRYHAIAELNRLQSNFPYGDDKHFMYVAYAKNDDDDNNNSNKDESVVGFCDIDARPQNRTSQQIASSTNNPRPYLSDLAVDVRWRRRGIARALIHACEEKAMNLGFDYLYLRVKFDNEPAILMYAEMGYDIMMDDAATDDTILLRKQVVKSSL